MHAFLFFLLAYMSARAFACGMVGHTSSYGCSKRTQIGKKFRNVLTFSSVSGELISDSDFTLRKYPNHHQIKFRSKQLSFEELGLGMITQLPLDPMHLIDLWIVKKMLVRLYTDITNFEVCKQVKEHISNHLKALKNIFQKNLQDIREIWKNYIIGKPLNSGSFYIIQVFWS